MRTITLRIKILDGIPLEAEVMSPDVLAPLTVEEMEALPVWHGNRKMKLVDMFALQVEGQPCQAGDLCLALEGDFSQVKRVGEGMSAGWVKFSGSAGMHTGNRMKGGRISIDGDAGDWLGREMTGGEILVMGSVGNYAGSAYRGERTGMRGGKIVIQRNAGSFLGDHMGGGEIQVAGDAGDFPGASNQGGTIFVGGDTYLPGAEMVKGRITVSGSSEVLPGFQGIEVVEVDGIRYQKLTGDLVENGKGDLYLGQTS